MGKKAETDMGERSKQRKIEVEIGNERPREAVGVRNRG